MLLFEFSPSNFFVLEYVVYFLCIITNILELLLSSKFFIRAEIVYIQAVTSHLNTTSTFNLIHDQNIFKHQLLQGIIFKSLRQETYFLFLTNLYHMQLCIVELGTFQTLKYVVDIGYQLLLLSAFIWSDTFLTCIHSVVPLVGFGNRFSQ